MVKTILSIGIVLLITACRRSYSEQQYATLRGHQVILGFDSEVCDYGPFTSGTTTAGWQEAINACFHDAKDLYISGGAGGPVYHIQNTILIPPAQDFKIDGGVYVLNWEGSPNQPLMIIDSSMNCDFRFGIMVYGGSSTALMIRPQGLVPIDKIAVFTENRLHIDSVANDSPFSEKQNMATGILFDGRNAPILCNHFDISAVLNFRLNIDVEGVVKGNHFDIWHLHTNLSSSNLLVAGVGVKDNWVSYVLGIDQGAVNVQPPIWAETNRIEEIWR